MRLGEKREWLKELQQGTEADGMRRTMEYLGILDSETGYYYYSHIFPDFRAQHCNYAINRIRKYDYKDTNK